MKFIYFTLIKVMKIVILLLCDSGYFYREIYYQNCLCDILFEFLLLLWLTDNTMFPKTLFGNKILLSIFYKNYILFLFNYIWCNLIFLEKWCHDIFYDTIDLEENLSNIIDIRYIFLQYTVVFYFPFIIRTFIRSETLKY